MSNLIWSAKGLDVFIKDGAIVLEQFDSGGSEYEFNRNRITITTHQVPQLVTVLRKAVAKLNASANGAVVQTRKYKYTRAWRSAGLGESKKASSPAADGKKFSEVGHDRK